MPLLYILSANYPFPNNCCSGSLQCRIGGDTPTVFETQTQMRLTNDRPWSILKASIIPALQGRCKPLLFFKHRELLFSFCVNRRFLHNSNWNPRYSCTLYSCLVRNLGCEVELYLTVSVHHPEKARLQQDAKNVIQWTKKLGNHIPP